jgi:RimJ/RimL family protein N-acetyltransferase
LDVKVAVGGSNPNMSSLRKAADAATDGQTRVELLVNSPSMPELMHWADLAVAAGGGTSWEIAYAGLPALFVILAENQEENARELEKQGFGICLGDHAPIDGCRLRAAVEGLANDAAMRAAFARRGRELVDGFGARRVAKLLYDNGDLELIRVTKADSGLLWEWANDPVTRANSFEPDLIPWDQHGSWLTARMHDLGCWFWLAEKPGFGKIGVIRFDRDGAEATVSICLAPHVRGRGLGSEIICAGCRRLFAESGVTVVRALIRTSNRASIGAFTRAGFQRDAVTLCKGHAAEQLLLHRPS